MVIQFSIIDNEKASLLHIQGSRKNEQIFKTETEGKNISNIF